LAVLREHIFKLRRRAREEEKMKVLAEERKSLWTAAQDKVKPCV
jgi:hypothetical protein